MICLKAWSKSRPKIARSPLPVDFAPLKNVIA